MNNFEAYEFFCEHKHLGARPAANHLISCYGLDSEEYNHFRLKFSNILKERDSFLKRSDLETWNVMSCCPLPKRPKFSITTSAISFEEDLSHPKRKHLCDLTVKSLRNRLHYLKSHLDSVAENEDISSKLLQPICYYSVPMMNTTLVVQRFVKK